MACWDRCKVLNDIYDYGDKNRQKVGIIAGCSLFVLILILWFSLNSETKGSDILKDIRIIDCQNNMLQNIQFRLNNDLKDFEFSKNKNCNDKNNIYKGVEYLGATTNLQRLYDGRIGAQVWEITSKCHEALEEIITGIDVMLELFKKENMILGESFKQIDNKELVNFLKVSGIHYLHKSPRILSAFKKLGVHFISLVNPLCKEHYNKTINITELVNKINDLGIVIDIGYSSIEMRDIVFNVSKAPVLNSYDLHYFSKNQNIKNLQNLKKHSGVYLISLSGEYFQNISNVIDELNFIYNTFGNCEHIGLASEFDKNEKSVAFLENVSKLPILFDYLYTNDPKRWNFDCLEKFANLNVLRVMKKAKLMEK